jgi:hypothetical protein
MSKTNVAGFLGNLALPNCHAFSCGDKVRFFGVAKNPSNIRFV